MLAENTNLLGIFFILFLKKKFIAHNDNLNKNLNQKKTEAEIWKNKYENQKNVIGEL